MLKRLADVQPGTVATVFDHRWFTLVQGKRQRMLVSLAYVATMALFPGVAWLTDSYAWSLLALLPMTAMALVLDGSVQGLTEMPSPMLDERQRRQRDAAFRTTYWIGSVLGLLGGFSSAWLFGREHALAAGLLVFTIAVLMGLPALVLAWTMPEAHDDED